MTARVMFLCTGNAARSQMAEAIANAFHGDVLTAVSSGSRPTGWVHPLATASMQAWDVDISGATSKGAAAFLDDPFDVVVMLCDSAADDCPAWPGAKSVERWSIVDPSYGPDDPATRPQRFLETRDELRRRIADLAKRVAADGIATQKRT